MNNMKMLSVLLPILFISACEKAPAPVVEKPAPAATPVKKEPVKTDYSVHMAALPLIQNTVRTMAPDFSNGFDLYAIRDVCRLARGETTKENVTRGLIARGARPESLARPENPLSILVNDDDTGRQALCAAYIARKVDSPFERQQFVEITQTRKPGSKKAVSEEKVNPEKLSVLLATKLASARANAEVFSLIATVLAQKKGLSSEEYYHETRTLFTKLSPYYLKRVQELFTPDLSGYILTSAEKNGSYSFISTGGYTFTRSDTSTLLSYRGVKWLGNGNIQGFKYFLQVKDIPEEVTNKLEGKEPEASKPKKEQM